jgi:hypothetical protein
MAAGVQALFFEYTLIGRVKFHQLDLLKPRRLLVSVGCVATLSNRTICSATLSHNVSHILDTRQHNKRQNYNDDAVISKMVVLIALRTFNYGLAGTIWDTVVNFCRYLRTLRVKAREYIDVANARDTDYITH